MYGKLATNKRSIVLLCRIPIVQYGPLMIPLIKSILGRRRWQFDWLVPLSSALSLIITVSHQRVLVLLLLDIIGINSSGLKAQIDG